MDIYKIYDTVNDYLEGKIDALLDFTDRHRYPLIITFSVHLLLVILIANVALSYVDVSDAKIVAITVEDLQKIEEELKDAGIDRLSIDAKMSTSQSAMSGFTNQAAADLGEDVDISKMHASFSTLKEAEAVTHQTDEYGEEVKIDLFSEQVKNRTVDLDEYQKIDTTRASKKPAKPFAGKSTVRYSFTQPERHNIAPIPVPIYTVRVGGLVVVDVKINNEGRVVWAQINRSQTTCPNEDAYQKAVTYARRARFNVDTNAPAQQEGYISYLFQ
ncbi:MAG: energy transducer TonB [Flavobacteriales bacterium]|nr:energy transducer TonB [Flavobacteriales bacterium]